MNITKNKISASLILILVLILLCTYINEISSMYKFGILVDDYKHIIASRPNYFALNSNINKYSWFTPVILPDSDVKIHVEHMVTANKTDINLIPEITDSNYLITIVECPYDKILSIDIENRINNQALYICMHGSRTMRINGK